MIAAIRFGRGEQGAGFPPNLCVSMMKFFSAALTDGLNLNSGFEGVGMVLPLYFVVSK